MDSKLNPGKFNPKVVTLKDHEEKKLAGLQKNGPPVDKKKSRKRKKPDSDFEIIKEIDKKEEEKENFKKVKIVKSSKSGRERLSERYGREKDIRFKSPAEKAELQNLVFKQLQDHFGSKDMPIGSLQVHCKKEEDRDTLRIADDVFNRLEYLAYKIIHSFINDTMKNQDSQLYELDSPLADHLLLDRMILSDIKAGGEPFYKAF